MAITEGKRITLFRVQFTRSITSSPEYAEICAASREQARDIFYGMYPTYFVTAVYEV